MKVFLLTFAAAVFLLGAAFGNQNILQKINADNLKNKSVESSVLSGETVNDPNNVNPAESTDENTENVVDLDEDITPFPKLVTVVPAKPATIPDQSEILSNLIYPGSQIGFESAQTLSMNSGDDPQSVSDWYREKFKELGFSVTSSSYVVNNNEYVIKQVAIDGGKNLNIEIIRIDSMTTKVTISIS